MEEPRTLRAEQIAQTRRALVGAGRLLFGRHGFKDTSVEDIASEARVTTGALYHHFPNKTALFEAVFEQLHEDVMAEAVAAAGRGRNSLDALLLGSDAFLEAVLEPEVQRILLLDAPAVLGLSRFTELDERYALRGIATLLTAARDEGLMTVADPDTTARLYMGALTRGAMLIANSGTPKRTRNRVSAALRELLGGGP
jgi:AcrR family transcriptional regulator